MSGSSGELPNDMAPVGQLAEVRRLPLEKLSDAALARALAAGDSSAQGQAWDRYSPLVRGLLRRSLGPDAEVEDLLQDVFIRFFKSVSSLRDDGAVRSFLIGITVRVVSNELRRRRVRRWLRLTPSGEVPEETTAVDEEAREALRRLYQILDGLSTEARLCFVLRRIQGLELTEVASALDVSLATAKRRIAKVNQHVSAQAARDPYLQGYADASEGRRGR